MSSFDYVNFSIRLNKNIERKVLFESIALMNSALSLETYRYIGLGSLWFVDFVLAHKYLRINDMVCIEHETGADRVAFNRPYDCITVHPGSTTDVLPEIDLGSKPNLIWLDYDTGPEGPALSDVEIICNRASVGTLLLLTVNAQPRRLGKENEREEALRLFCGDLIPQKLPRGALADNYRTFLAEIMFAKIYNAVHKSGRELRFLPIFNVYYRDGQPMITVGGMIADAKYEQAFLASEIRDCEWASGEAQISILAPPLTVKEKIAFDRLLPSEQPPNRDKLGFPLNVEEIEAYHRYYRFYPLFAEFQF